jgi:histidine ammonia-lyase
MTRTVALDGEPAELEDVAAVAAGAGVVLGPGAEERLAASRAVVEEVLVSGRAVYGLTTWVGHMRNERVPDEELRRAQLMLLRTHASGLGPPLPTELVRAAMMVRLVGLTRGGSGASPAVARTLAAMLNAGVHPVVPSTGSIGSGDLGQLANVGLVAVGQGEAELDGEIVPGGLALERAGIPPLVLEPKDGLALMSANGVSIGQAIMLIRTAVRAAEAADLAAACAMEATAANPSVVQPAVGLAKPYPGQIAAAAGMLAALEGSAVLDPDATPSVQDPISFRVTPQVHGAFREQLDAVRRAAEVELNARADNPLVWVPGQTMVSNGNFHPMVLALALDGLRLAIAHVGQLSERRMSHLWNAFFTRMAAGGPPQGPGPPSDLPTLPGLGNRYAAAAVLSELRQLAAPASLDAPILDMGVEDHATSAPLAARLTVRALELLGDVLAAELLLVRDVLAMGPPPRLGKATAAILSEVEAAITAAGPGATPGGIHRELRRGFPEAP